MTNVSLMIIYSVIWKDELQRHGNGVTLRHPSMVQPTRVTANHAVKV